MEVRTLIGAIRQLESCGYECEAGPLENNEAFQELKKIAESDCDSCIEEFNTSFDEQQKEVCQKCKANLVGSKSETSKPAFNARRLRDLTKLNNDLLDKLLTHGRGDGGCSLSANEIRYVAELFKSTIDLWHKEG